MYITEFTNYLESEKRFSKHTVTAYIKDLQQFISFLTPESGSLQISKVDHRDIRSWLVEMMDEQDLTSKSVNRKLSSLKTYFRFLRATKRVENNPTLKVVSPKVSKKLPEFVDAKSMDKLLDVGMFETDFKGLRDQLVMELLYQTGMRLSELIGLALNDVDYIGKALKVTGKRNKQRIIPVNSTLLTTIKVYLKEREERLTSVKNLIISDTGKAAYPKLIYNIVNKYLGIISTNTKKSPHVLRHTFATHMLNNGADLNTIKSLLGHANLSATQVYTHNSFEKLKSVHTQAHPRA